MSGRHVTAEKNTRHFGLKCDYAHIIYSETCRVCAVIRQSPALKARRPPSPGPIFLVQVYRRLQIGRDGHLDQSEAHDIS